ncbi:MAG TPA: hypothetical protein VFV38_12385 [Ktedonobacteraceae bacterium]|nr:hypothetical protein [Ktedonobacteraceae bacterium]
MPSETTVDGNGNGALFRVRSSQVSAAPFPGGGLSGRRGVPLAVSLPFLLTGASVAALFALLAPWVLPLALQAPGFPHVLALVHIVTLGWLTMIIMGASLQLTPVIVVAPLRATALLRWQYPVFLCGVVCLVSGFWWWQIWLLITGGTLLVLAVAHYVIVLGVTFTRATTRPLSVAYLSSSLVYLCLVVSLGLTLAWNFVAGFLSATLEHLLLIHVTLGVVGWLSGTLMGVSYTLGRLFSLAHTHDDRWGKRIWFVLNGGIVVLATGELLDWPLLEWGGGALLILAAGLFAVDFWRMLRSRQRKKLEVTQYHSIAATGYFVCFIVVGVVLLLPGWGTSAVFTALGLVALVGWLGQSTVGYLYKIVPFLVWSERYGPLVGKQKVPLMRDLVHQRWTWASWWLLNLSLPIMIGAVLTQQVIVLQVACGGLASGLCLFAANLLLVVRHVRAPGEMIEHPREQNAAGEH